MTRAGLASGGTSVSVLAQEEEFYIFEKNKNA